MSLNDTIKAKSDALRELIPMIEGGDAEAAKSARSIMDELKEARDAKAAADEAAEMLKGLGAPEGAKAAAKKTMRDEIADGIKGVDVHAEFNRSFEMKAAATDVLTTPTITDTSTIVPEAPQDLGVLELFGSETIAGNNLDYLVALGFTGEPGMVAELGAKPQIGPSYENRSDKLSKVAEWWKESDEAIEDADYLVSAFRNRGIYLLRKKEELQAIKGNGDGQSVDLQGVWNRTGVQALTFVNPSAQSNGTMAIQVLRAVAQIMQVTGYAPDGVVLNPLDYFKLRTATDVNGQFFGGGYFSGPYGQGGVSLQPALWGLRTVQSNAVAEGEILVGAFRPAAAIVRKRGSGIRVEIANQHEDDFTHNRVTVRVEERLGLAVRVPQAFVKLTAE